MRPRQPHGSSSFTGPQTPSFELGNGGLEVAIYQLTAGGVRLNGAEIPNDPQNRDWRRYQDWLALGNTPDPAEAVSPAPTRGQIYLEIAERDFNAAMIQAMATKLGIDPAVLRDEVVAIAVAAGS